MDLQKRIQGLHGHAEQAVQHGVHLSVPKDCMEHAVQPNVTLPYYHISPHSHTAELSLKSQLGAAAPQSLSSTQSPAAGAAIVSAPTATPFSVPSALHMSR